LHPIPGAHKLQGLPEPAGYSLDHIRHQGAGEAVQGTMCALVTGTPHDDPIIFE
jgi:hypothetical protein